MPLEFSEAVRPVRRIGAEKLSLPSPKAHEIDAKKENRFLMLCPYTFGHAAHGHEVAVLDTPAPASDEDILHNHSVVCNTK